MEILYISEISQLDYVLKTNPLLLNQHRPMTGDMVVAFELEKLGINFIDEWNYLKPEEFKNNWDLAHTLSNTWWHDKAVSPFYHGFSLCETTQQDMVYSFTACLNARDVYARVFREFKINQIEGYFLQNTAVVRTGPAPTYRAVSSLTQSILFYMADKIEIPVVKLQAKNPLTNGQMEIKKNKLSALRALWNRPPDIIKNDCVIDKDSGKVIIIYEALMPSSEYSALVDVLGNLSGVKIIRISMQVLAEGSKIIDSELDINEQVEIFWQKYLKTIESKNNKYPEIFSNKHLIFQFERIKNEMLNAVNYGNIFEIFLDLLKPSLVIFAHEAFTVERTLVGITRSKNIPTLSLVHTGLGALSGYRGVPGDADWLMVWNNTDIEALAYYGINKNRLKNIGSLRYENDYIEYSRLSNSKVSQAKIEAKKNLGFKLEKPLITLLTTAINTGFASSIGNPQKHRQTIRELVALINSRQDLQFAIKAHPSTDYYELYRRLIKSNDHTNLTFVEGAKLGTVLQASDVCLMINYCTTAALEAMLKKVPIIYINTAVYPLLEWHDNLSKTGIHRISSIFEFDEILNDILLDKNIRNNLLEKSKKQAHEIIINSNILPSNRLSIFLKEILSINSTNCHISLLQSKNIKNFYLKNLDVNIYNSIKKRSYQKIALSYLSGYNNLGTEYFNIICPEKFSNFKTFKEIFLIYKQQGLISSYISGRLQNWENKQSKFKDLVIILPYLINPCNFINLASQEKLNILKFILQTGREFLHRKSIFKSPLR